jgi:HEAT repeat protein
MCLLAALAALAGCASLTDHALDLGEAQAWPAFPNRIEVLSGIALDRSARPATRFAAVRSLAHIGGSETVGPLSAIAGSDEPSPLRRWAVWGLGRTDAPSAVPVLIEVAGAARDPSVARQALQGLARVSGMVVDDPEARRAVLGVVNAAECRFRGQESVCALAGLLRKDLASLADFAAVLEKSVEAGGGPAAYNALCWTGDLLLESPDAAGPGHKEALAALTGLLRSDTPALRTRALWYLGRIADAGTAPELARTAGDHPDRATRLLAVWALWRSDRPLFEQTFTPMPADLLHVTPANWREARDRAAELGEPDLEIQRLIADLLREDGR